MDLSELLQQAYDVRDADQEGENTALRVGRLLVDIVETFNAVFGGGTVEGLRKVGATTVEAGTITATQMLEAGNMATQTITLQGTQRYLFIDTVQDGLFRIRNPYTGKSVLLRTDANGTVALISDLTTLQSALQSQMTSMQQGLQAQIDAESARIDELEGTCTVSVMVGQGTFYRRGQPNTDNWCEKFVASGNVGLVVQTATPAGASEQPRKFNLRDRTDQGLYIASGDSGNNYKQRWNIEAPDGYRINGYKIVATMRDSETSAFITPANGSDYLVYPNIQQTIEVENVNAQSTYFTTEDISNPQNDHQILLVSFEVYVERTAAYATTADVEEGMQEAKDYADELDNATNLRINNLGTVYNVRGSSAWTVADPTSQLYLSMPGDVWNITESFTLGGKTYPAGTNVVCISSSQSTPDVNARFDALSGITDLSNYYTKSEADALLAAKASIADLKAGRVVPAAAGDLLSWSRRALTPNTASPMSDVKVRSTAGDASIVTSVPAYFQKIVPTTHIFSGLNFRASGFNLLRLTSNNGVAEKGSGDWWYIPVPKLTFVGYGAHGDNNGLILTAEGGTNINNATVYFKPFSSGVPASATDGTAATYSDAQGIRFYTTSAAGWLIISGITWASTCAHLAWSITADYSKYVSPTDANDGGTMIDLTGVGSGLGTLHKAITVADSAERTGNTSMLKTVRVGYSSTLTWTTVQDTVEQGATQTYTHTATISGMKSEGEVSVVIGTTEQAIVVSGTTISIQDTNDQATWDALTKETYYQLAVETASTITINTLVSVNDMGIEVLNATAGTATVTMLYAQGIQDTVAYIVSEWQPGIQDEVALLAQEIEELTSALYGEMAKDPDMKYGQPRILWGNGVPAEATIPTNWRQFLDGGYNWIGKPAFVGQVYINTAVTSGGYYIGYKKSDYTLDWRTIVA